MAEKIYFLLILCGNLCIHQILAAESSDNLVRGKRVISSVVGEDRPVHDEEVPYVVNIRGPSSEDSICVGVILSRRTVITVANCVAPLNVTSIKVVVGSTFLIDGVEHNVIRKNIKIGYQRRNGDGVALLTVEPPIIFNTRTTKIDLHEEVLLPGTRAIISGWGCNPTEPRGTDFPYNLRSITVQVMNHTNCVNSCRGHIAISENDICTYHPNKRCGHTDAGAPLVVNYRLVGLHLWTAPLPGRIGLDVFVALQSLEYGRWVRNNIIHNVGHMHGAK